MAAAAGCDVAANVTRKTTMLVVGTQDRSKLKGYAKSTKHRKAETLIERGPPAVDTGPPSTSGSARLCACRLGDLGHREEHEIGSGIDSTTSVAVHVRFEQGV